MSLFKLDVRFAYLAGSNEQQLFKQLNSQISTYDWLVLPDVYEVRYVFFHIKQALQEQLTARDIVEVLDELETYLSSRITSSKLAGDLIRASQLEATREHVYELQSILVQVQYEEHKHDV